MGFLSGYKTSANFYIRNHDDIILYKVIRKTCSLIKFIYRIMIFAPILKTARIYTKYLINQV